LSKWFCTGHTRVRTKTKKKPCPECCGYKEEQ
jgi:hypothetical protein